METQRIAVIGSGISGLASAWLLNRRHEVTLFEREAYFGGHTHTHEVDAGDGRRVAVDSGFIVFNERNYPNLCGLFDVLGVRSRSSDMSFGVSLDDGLVEYAGSSLATLYAQRSNVLSPTHQRMVWDILRFNRRCKQDLDSGQLSGLTVDEYLRRRGLGSAFRDRYLLPMAAAIWSCPVATMGRFPVSSLARFFRNHGLLDVAGRPVWRTVVGGSHSYVRRMLEDLPPRVFVRRGATRVERGGDAVQVCLEDGSREVFDQVVVATHADQALRLLGDPSARERAMLGRFGYQANRAILHSDADLMPRRRKVWSSWNYLANSATAGGEDARVSVTYWMNNLQGLDTERSFFVTLNPLREPRPEHVIAEMTYEHPVFDHAAMAAQPNLASLQGQRRTWYCGSYFGYGFHEDALASAVAVSRSLGVAPPWEGSEAAEGRAPLATLTPGLQGA